MNQRNTLHFTNTLGFRIALLVSLAELILLTITGLLYYSSFNAQIEEALIDSILLPYQLINDGLLEFDAVIEQDRMTQLVGEGILNAFIVGVNDNIFFSLDSSFTGQRFSTLGLADGVSLFDLAEPLVTEDDEGHIFALAPLVGEDGRSVRFYIVVEVSSEIANAQRLQIAQLFVVGTLGTMAITTVVILLLLNNAFITPIRSLLRNLEEIEKGNLATRVPENTTGEIGILQRQTNQMVIQLEDLVNNLEERIKDRTRDLTLSALISRRIASLLQRERLLPELVDRTAVAFDFYQVSIFEYDHKDGMLRLVAASGSAGAKMLEKGKFFLMSDQGLVPTAARNKKSLLINDVTKSPEHRYNEYLPETSSEAAIPILFGDTLIGVLDLQSKQIARFQPTDLHIFASLADQFAVAFRNAALFEEVEEARAIAEQADKAKSAFLASTSHELRTPLNAIINLTSFVKRGMMGPTTPRQEEILALVMQSGQNLLSLINDVLDMSKIESGSLKLYIEQDIDVVPIIDQAVNTAESLLEDKPVDLIVEIQEFLPLMTVDKHRFRQMLINILSNACKFTEEGMIRICANTEGDHLLVSVQDTGIGIAEEDQDKVFEKFLQTDSGLRQGGGTGLGMPITKNLVEAHGGRIWLESQLNVGTTFFFIIPISNPAVSIFHTQEEAS